MYDHPTWDEFEELPDATKKLIQKQTDYQINEVAERVEKSSGSIPGEMKNILKRIRHVEPQKFDWKRYLKRFIGSSSIVYTKKTRRKINKRYIGSPALKIKTRNHVLVGIDTSGSVNIKELYEFLNELHHISKTGHEITVAQCDTQISSLEKLNIKKDIKITGRGGTSFQPVIDHFNENGKYTTLIYFTDGEACSPESCPKNTLWVLSSVSDMNNSLPGKVIKLN